MAVLEIECFSFVHTANVHPALYCIYMHTMLFPVSMLCVCPHVCATAVFILSVTKGTQLFCIYRCHGTIWVLSYLLALAMPWTCCNWTVFCPLCLVVFLFFTCSCSQEWERLWSQALKKRGGRKSSTLTRKGGRESSEESVCQKLPWSLEGELCCNYIDHLYTNMFRRTLYSYSGAEIHEEKPKPREEGTVPKKKRQSSGYSVHSAKTELSKVGCRTGRLAPWPRWRGEGIDNRGKRGRVFRHF